MKLLSLFLIVLTILGCNSPSQPKKTTLDSAKEASVKYIQALKDFEDKATDTNKAKAILLQSQMPFLSLKQRLSPSDTMILQQYYDSVLKSYRMKKYN